MSFLPQKSLQHVIAPQRIKLLKFPFLDTETYYCHAKGKKKRKDCLDKVSLTKIEA